MDRADSERERVQGFCGRLRTFGILFCPLAGRHKVEAYTTADSRGPFYLSGAENTVPLRNLIDAC